MAEPTSIEIETPRGLARVRLHALADAPGSLVLGHGAGGGIDAPDLQAATREAAEHGITVALVEQPYRVAGRRAPAPAAHLDEAWLAVIEALRAGAIGPGPLITGGRSMGARVACRTAFAAGAAAVLCLAFPLLPPRRARASRPPASRLAELEATWVPTLVVQGARDPFGVPPAAPSRRVATVSGDHSLRADLPGLRAAIGEWLGALEL